MSVDGIGRNFVAPDDLAMLHGVFEMLVRILNLDEPGAGFERIPDDVQPVGVAKLLRLGPFAVFKLDRIARGVALDLDSPDLHRADGRIEGTLSTVVEAGQLFMSDSLDQFLGEAFGDQILLHDLLGCEFLSASRFGVGVDAPLLHGAGDVGVGREHDGGGQVFDWTCPGDLQAIQAGKAFVAAALQVIQVSLRFVGCQLVFWPLA